MNFKVNYIVSVYCGKRRNYPKTPFKKFIERHIDFLSEKPENINGFTFVINKSNNLDNDKYCIDIVSQFIERSDLKGIVILRDNVHGSYGAWEKGVLDTHQDYTHSFLIEDDYIPCVSDFSTVFLNKMSDDEAVFTASLFENNHASISNGLLNNTVVFPTLQKNGKLFKLQSDKRYGGFLLCQTTFLLFIDGFKNDISKEFNTVFLKNNNKTEVFGNNNGQTLITPI